MKVVEITLENFRGYKEETKISIDDLTVIIGKNDSGKSTILDALNIFFNDESIDKDDLCVYNNSTDIKISCTFTDLPESIIVDTQHPTTLQKEFLVRQDGLLEISKIFSFSSARKQINIFAKALHPSAEGYSDLLSLKIKELKERAKDKNINLTGVDQKTSSAIRQAIWSQTDNLDLKMQDIDLISENGKKIWDQIQLNLPIYALFKSDRSSTDQDDEAQDPMKAAIKETIKSHEDHLKRLTENMKAELDLVAKKTVEKIHEMNPELAKKLNPQIKNKNWESLFSISLTGDNDIPINKRGSGTRRMILLNFFRAKAENTALSKNTGIIYAIEEPETSQHPNHQLLMLDAFQELVAQNRCQIILTTHTPTLARKIERNFLRFVKTDGGTPKILNGSEDSTLEEVKASLGILVDHDISAFIGVEGKWDIEFLKAISKTLAMAEPDIPNLEQLEKDGKIMFVPLGGSSLELWTSRLSNLCRPEFYITDRDTIPPAPPKYQEQINLWNSRPNCHAWATNKKELENYIHPEIVRSDFPTFPETINDNDDVPNIIAQIIHSSDSSAPAWPNISEKKRKEKERKAKKLINQDYAKKMTVELLNISDPNNEIRTWLRSIGNVFNTNTNI